MDSDDVFGLKRTLNTGCGRIHFQAFFDKDTGELTDIFCPVGSQGKLCSNFTTMSRMMTLAISKGATSDDILDQLHSAIPCPTFIVRTRVAKDTSKGTSCSGAMAYALKDMCEKAKERVKEPKKEIIIEIEIPIPPDPVKKIPVTTIQEIGNTCPDCGNHLANIGGCLTCSACGWSRCG